MVYGFFQFQIWSFRFKVAINKDECDWLKSILDCALIAKNHQAELEKDPINITYGILDHMLKVLDEEDILAKQIIPCLATLSKKCKFYCDHNFVKKFKK